MDVKSMFLGLIVGFGIFMLMGSSKVGGEFRYEAISSNNDLYVIDRENGTVKKVIEAKTGKAQLDKSFQLMDKRPLR